MATKPEEVTELELLKPKEVKELLGIGINRANQIINKLNQELKEKGYIVFEHRILKSYLLKRIAVGVKL